MPRFGDKNLCFIICLSERSKLIESFRWKTNRNTNGEYKITHSIFTALLVVDNCCFLTYTVSDDVNNYSVIFPFSLPVAQSSWYLVMILNACCSFKAASARNGKD
jgi:hypothetical protein